MDKNDRLSNGPFYCLSSLKQECAEGVDKGDGRFQERSL